MAESMKFADGCGQRRAGPQLRRTVAIVGLMGSGKSAIGKRLACRLEVPFSDSDDLVEAAAGMTVSEISRPAAKPRSGNWKEMPSPGRFRTGHPYSRPEAVRFCARRLGFSSSSRRQRSGFAPASTFSLAAVPGTMIDRCFVAGISATRSSAWSPNAIRSMRKPTWCLIATTGPMRRPLRWPFSCSRSEALPARILLRLSAR